MPVFRRRREQWDQPEPRCAFLVACADDLAGLELQAKAGEREPEHWGDFAVLELALVG